MSRALRLGLIWTLSLCSCTSLVDDPLGAGGADSDAGSGGSAGRGGGAAPAGGKAPGSSAGGDASQGGKASAGADAQIYLDAHNAVRASVEAPAGYAGVWQPLPPVAWSAAVATSAQGWADHLASTLDCGLEHERDSGYGENLAAGTSVGAERAVDMWASERENYVYAPRYVFSGDTGHYTQIVWRTSTSIGCASAKCSRSSVVVCRYDPPGNFIGGDIY